MEELGKGFHAHIVAKCPKHNKAQVLRDTQNTFKAMAEHNCVDVAVAKRPQDIIDKYLHYISKDGHKEPMQEWDELWRKQIQMDHLYTQDIPPPKRSAELKLPYCINPAYQVHSAGKSDTQKGNSHT